MSKPYGASMSQSQLDFGLLHAVCYVEKCLVKLLLFDLRQGAKSLAFVLDAGLVLFCAASCLHLLATKGVFRGQDLINRYVRRYG